MMSLTADHLAMPASTDDAETGRIAVAHGLAALEPDWRRFEAEALATPYGRFDWIRAFADDGADLAVLTRRDPDGRLDLLWPFRTVRRFGLAVAVPVGGRHANVNLPLIRPDAADALRPLGLLQAFGRRTGVDLVCIPRVPAEWAGRSVPLAALGRPNPDVAPTVRLDADHETTARRTMSNEARKRLRNKERGLAKHGPVAFRQARSVGDVDELLRTFFRQKAERFAALGIPDPFASEPVRRAVRAAATGDLAAGRPAIELYGLWVGDTIAAVLGAAASATHLSAMFISFEHWPEILRFSPGDILMSRVVQAQFAMGRRQLDFGTGRAHYKSIFCDEEIVLSDVVVPITTVGAVAALGLRASLAARAGLKRSPTAMRLIGHLRRPRPGPSF